MKRYIYLIFLCSIISCTSLNKERPEWFGISGNPFENTIINSYIIGYGSSNNYTEAFAYALTNIAQQMGISVESSVRYHIKDNGDRLEIVFDERSSQDIYVEFTNKLEVYRFEKIGNNYYIAIIYDNRPASHIFASTYIGSSTQDSSTNCKNIYLNETPLIKEIFELVGNEVKITISFHNDRWYINNRNIRVPLSKTEVEELFTTVTDDQLPFQANSKKFSNGEHIHFSVTNLTDYDGYVSIFNVYNNGYTSLLCENLSISKEEEMVIRQSNGIDIIAVPFGEENSTKDLFVAVLSNNAINTDQFQRMDDTVQASGCSMSFHKVIELMQNNIFSSFVTYTERN